MRISKKIVSRLLLSAEVVFFGNYYIFDVSGLPKLYSIQEKHTKVKQEIAMLEQDIAHLSYNIDNWHNNPFYKEKYAREQLQMMGADEEVIFIINKKEKVTV